MKAVVYLIAFAVFLFSAIKAEAAITFTISNPQLSEEGISFDVAIAGLTSSSCPNTFCFLQAALTPQSTTHYFGLTKNLNNEWFEYISSPDTGYIQSMFFKFQPINASWSGSLMIRPNPSDPYYIGKNTFTLKAWRYTGNSQSYSGLSDNTLSVELTGPTPTSLPTDTPVPTKIPTSTPKSTNTPIAVPTKTPILTSKPSLTPIPSSKTFENSKNSVLGTSTKESPVISVTKDIKVESASSSPIGKIFIALGLIFLILCGIVIIWPIRHEIIKKLKHEA